MDLLVSAVKVGIAKHEMDKALAEERRREEIRIEEERRREEIRIEEERRKAEEEVEKKKKSIKANLWKIESSNKIWEFKTDNPIKLNPFIYNKFIYFSDNKNIYRLDTENTISKEKLNILNINVFSSVSVGTNIFITDTSMYFGKDNIMYCINDKNEVWSYKTGDNVKNIITSPFVIDKYVYFGSNKIFYSLNADGDDVWTCELRDSITSDPCVSNDFIYFGSNNILFCLDRNKGRKIWKFTAENKIKSKPFVANGYVYFGCDDKKMYCLDAKKGNKVWGFETKDKIKASPYVVNGYIYFGSFESLYCLDAKNGKKVWEFEIIDEYIDTIPCIADGYIYFGSDDKYFYCLDAKNGDKVWEFETKDKIKSSPCVVDGLVYFGSNDGCFYCLDTGIREKIIDKYESELKNIKEKKLEQEKLVLHLNNVIEKYNIPLQEAYNLEKKFFGYSITEKEKKKEEETKEEARKKEEEARKKEEEARKKEEEARKKEIEARKKEIEPEMVYINGGIFRMGNNNGNDNEKPVHNVTVGSFYMGKYAVTNKEYVAFLNDIGNLTENSNTWSSSNYEYNGIIADASGFYVKTGYENRPVVFVNWNDAVAYCEWLSRKTGKYYRLPTEAEWEYACRAGTTTEYYWGDEIDGCYCGYMNNSGGGVKPVGQRKPNGFGLYDMSGNVWDWCSDWYGDYPSESVNNPTGPKSGSERIIRGGGFSSIASYCRSMCRYWYTPDNRYIYLGFRLVKKEIEDRKKEEETRKKEEETRKKEEETRNNKKEKGIIDFSGWTLHRSAKKGELKIAELLISKSINVNDKDKDGQTPLHIASENGHKEIAELLISKGADINAKDNEGITPLAKASGEGHKEVSELLILKGADINAKNKNNATPLFTASATGQREIAELLISKGADVNVKTISGWTPLHIASDRGHEKVVELLISKGADVNAKNDNSDTPLSRASHKHEGVVKLLISKGAEKDKSNCFITAATCLSLHKTDNCYELNAFRNFRDTWLQYQPGGDKLINEYYSIAPTIVENINGMLQKDKIYNSIWSDYLSKCLSLIEDRRYEEAKELYIKMVTNFKNIAFIA